MNIAIRIKQIALVSFALAVGTIAPGQVEAAPDNIDRALMEKVPFIMNELKQAGVKTVGVIPFRYTIPGQSERASGSLIPTNIAARVERALVLYRDPSEPVDVIFNTLSQARSVDPSIEYFNADGRKAFFAISYRPPVPAPAVQLDCLLSGRVKISPDWKETTLQFEYCMADGRVFPSEPIAMQTDRNMLIAAGKGFSLSRLASSGRAVEVSDQGLMDALETETQWSVGGGMVAAADKAASTKETDAVRSRLTGSAIADPWKNLPVKLVIRYNDQPQQLRGDVISGSSNLSINDPKANERVTFDLVNTSAERVGVVLAVNGKSVLYNQPAADPDAAAKFILEPGQTYRVQGVYESDLRGYRPLMGMSDADSTAASKGMPSDSVGLIQLHVFRKTSVAPGQLTDTGKNQKKPDASRIGQDNNQQPIKPSGDGSGVQQAGQTNNGQPTNPGGGELFTLPGRKNGWQSGFNWSFVNAAGAETVEANGSLQPSEVNSSADSWDALKQSVATGVINPNENSRGLMAAQGNVQNQQLKTDRLGAVTLTDTITIRYFSIAGGNLFD